MNKKESVLIVAKKEYKKEKLQRKVEFLLGFMFLVSFFIFLLIILSGFFNFTGYSNYVMAEAGYINSLELTATVPVYSWGGIYGLAFRVPGFFQQFYKDIYNGTIVRQDVFFDCIQEDVIGGPEVYASTSQSINFLTDTVSPAPYSMIDEYIGCVNEPYCANNTFTHNMTIYLGSTRISEIPSTYTYKYDGQNNVFDVGALNVSNNLVFVSHINDSLQRSYNYEYIVNYQMLVPTPIGNRTTYYFYTDPYDVCPEGGIGSTLIAGVYGYVLDAQGDAIPNASVNIVGQSNLTDENGFFNISFLVVAGTYHLIAQKEGYGFNYTEVPISYTTPIVHRNVTLFTLSIAQNVSASHVAVSGYVNSTSGAIIENATVSFSNSSTLSNASGFYFINASVYAGQNAIISIKEDYDNYYAFLNVSGSGEISHNISMSPVNLNTFVTGPYATGPFSEQPVEIIQKIEKQAEEEGKDYWVSTRFIQRQVRKNTFVEDEVAIYNFNASTRTIIFTLSPNLNDFIKLDRNVLIIPKDDLGVVKLTIYGTPPEGLYTGTLTLSGSINQEIPVQILVVERYMPVDTLRNELDLFKKIISPGSKLTYKVDLSNFLVDQSYKVRMRYFIQDSNKSQILMEKEDEIEIKDSVTLVDFFDIPKNFSEGNYILRADAIYFGLVASASAPFIVAKPLYMYSFFGIPLWMIFAIISLLSFLAFNFFLYHRHMEKKKRYHLSLNLDTLPKPGPRSVKIGKIAETNIDAYYDLDMFTTHAVVAGATGGGKSISAQVFVEEALLKGISVIVFDPTAQWSGMLRKCDDKKMMSFYPKFNLKPTDAKAFNGSVRLVKNPRELIDIKKYMNPGQIQVFCMNKMDPSEIDLFVSNAIISVFKSDPSEHPGLRTLLVFDEVHRLLPKFGGSGKGFLQIERACREFRKWGFGVLLVSQVLSDFVGEIKANINTEVQMRVAEENDLERVKERYGADALKSLVRSEVGTGMIQNAEYNRGKPYFVQLRPILHNTRRLTDEILDKYNQYGEMIDDFDYQIKQLELEKVDTFDLKMELKLIKDKLMNGNFSVVDIYVEGLKPRFEKLWEKLGKKPKKYEVKLIDLSELESSLKAAQQERSKWDQENKSKGGEGGKEEVKKEDISKKIVKSLTFDNGIMVSTLAELRDSFPSIDNQTLAIHINDEKNDVATWLLENFDKNLAEKVKPLRDKKSIITQLEEFIKESNKDEKKDVKEENKNVKEENKDEKASS